MPVSNPLPDAKLFSEGAELRIESKGIDSLGDIVDHLYLVYRDGDGAEWVIRGGPETPWDIFGGDFEFQINVEIEASADARGSDTPEDRHSTLVDTGALTADEAWGIMVRYIRDLDAQDYPPFVLTGTNSNALVGSMLAAIGLEPDDNLPDGVSVSDVPGLTSYSTITGTVTPPENGDVLGTAAADLIQGIQISEAIFGLDGEDTVHGGRGGDEIHGGNARDLLFGEDGDDMIFGEAGDDTMQGGAGNDILVGGARQDLMGGGTGNDTLTGSAGADMLTGDAGADFINGGYGFDRGAGGDGADRFFHLGVGGHGSDWIEDYSAAQGDVLQVGIAGATAGQFRVTFGNTANAGDAGVDEAFVTYIPTRQVLWAMVDGGAQAEINLWLGGQVHDLLA